MSTFNAQWLRRRLYMPVLLGLSTVMCVAFLVVRAHITGSPSFRMLLWNLFLAWIPFGTAWLISIAEERRRIQIIPYLILLVFWLLFFPNAPYILTDFVHLRARPPAPLWFDLALILSFAWTGLMLGLVSLRLVHNSLHRRFGKAAGRTAVAVALLLAGFGIYLGRFERWNSWDIVFRFDELTADVLMRVSNPLAHPRTIAVTLVFALFLLLAYAVLSFFHQGIAVEADGADSTNAG